MIWLDFNLELGGKKLKKLGTRLGDSAMAGHGRTRYRCGMYLRITQRQNRDGSTVAYYGLAERAWQDGLQVTLTSGSNQALTMRGVPDVSGNADPETGYDVRIDGTDTAIGGTSAVAPLWAGLIARINAAKRSSVGIINPLLYAAPSALNNITSGNNGNFAAGPGWDACTGLGSPDGTKIATLLEQAPTS